MFLKTNVLCIDPGKTTGLVYASFDNDKITVKPNQCVMSVSDLWNYLNLVRPDNIVCEDFEFRRHLDWAELYPVQLIGIVNLYAEQVSNYTDLVMQKARLIHGTGAFFDNKDKIRELGLWKPGEKYHHAMDAMRHFLHWFYFGKGSRLKENYKEGSYPPFELVLENNEN